MEHLRPITGGSITNNYLLPPIIPAKESEYIKKRGEYIDNILKNMDLSKLNIQIPVLNKSMTNNYLLPPTRSEDLTEYARKNIENAKQALNKMEEIISSIRVKQPVTNNRNKFRKTRKRNSAINLSGADH